MSDKKASGAAGETMSSLGAEAASGTAQPAADRHNGEGGAKDRLKSQADELMQAAKQRAKDVASEQKDAAAAQLGCVARGLRDAAGSMQGESEFAGRYASKAAEGLERFAQDLRGADFDELVQRTESYARRNPGVFLGGAVAAGFLLARFIKSSHERSGYRSSGEAHRARSDAPQSAASSGV